MTLNVEGENANILGCYTPTLDYEKDDKDQFYAMIDRIFSQVKRDDKII